MNRGRFMSEDLEKVPMHDKVVLASGGPLMTVEKMTDTEALCRTPDGEYHWFAFEALRRLAPFDPRKVGS